MRVRCWVTPDPLNAAHDVIEDAAVRNVLWPIVPRQLVKRLFQLIHLPGDWYPLGLPENIVIGNDVYIDSSYAFAGFHSTQQPGLTVGDASGVYDREAFVVGPRGRVSVGAFTVLNGTYVICEDRIDIGAHCLLAWGVVISDN